MAIALTVLKRGIAGNERIVIATAQFDATYVTGGMPVTLAQWVALLGHGYGTTNVLNAGNVHTLVSETDILGNHVAINRATGAMLLFAAGAEAGSGSNQSAVNVRFRASYDMNVGG